VARVVWAGSFWWAAGAVPRQTPGEEHMSRGAELPRRSPGLQDIVGMLAAVFLFEQLISGFF